MRAGEPPLPTGEVGGAKSGFDSDLHRVTAGDHGSQKVKTVHSLSDI